MADTQNKYDFSAFNKATNGIGVGLKLHLATQMLEDVEWVFRKFKNPLETDMTALISELKEIRVKAKQAAAERMKAQS